MKIYYDPEFVDERSEKARKSRIAEGGKKKKLTGQFLIEKLSPQSAYDYKFNQEELDKLIHLSSYGNIPHIIISGPDGSGKQTMLNTFLEYIYGEEVNNLYKTQHKVSGSSTKKEITFMQSPHHIVIQPTNTNHDKYILQQVVESYAKQGNFTMMGGKSAFKTIVILNTENLSHSSQSTLRRTMENHAKTCRFIMVCNNLSKIFDPLKSRCRIYCVPAPSPEEITRIMVETAILEKINVTKTQIQEIIVREKYNLKNCLWALDYLKYEVVSETIDLDKIYDNIIECIFKAVKIINENKGMLKPVFDKMRNDVYAILIGLVEGPEIISTLLDKIINKIQDDKKSIEIIRIASTIEQKLICGRRDITQTDYFVLSIIQILID